jgi:hypothetical protein
VTPERRYQSPAALERAIGDLLRQRYPKQELQYRRNEVAFRRLIARMYATEPEGWVLKGGFALILRLDPNRTSNDIDVTYVHEAGEHAVALEALEQAVRHDLDDFFSFEIAEVGAETEDRARRVTVLCRLGAREFARFRVDLAIPSPNVPSDRVEAPPLSGVDEIDALPAVLVLAWPEQVADKICAIFEIHGDVLSTRPRDLADIGMIARQVNALEGGAMIDALRAEESRRRDRTLPEGLPDLFVLPEKQAEEWRASFEKASRGAPISFDDALALAQLFVNPLLDDSARGKRWNATSERYEE